MRVVALGGVALGCCLVLTQSFRARAQENPTTPEPESVAAVPSSDDPFPLVEGLRERVDFWKSVYAVWSLGQVVLHDIDHPSLVYEIIDLPGEAGENYTEWQRNFVRSRREALEARLRGLESKIESHAPLSEDEKALALQVTTTAGVEAIEGAHTRVRSQRGLRERFRRGLELSGRYDSIFREIFREAGLPDDLSYLPHVESSFQAHARSSAGAVGVWQFTRPAAKVFMKVNSAIDERLDPIASARGAARYLARAYELLGDWPMSVTSYNHGIEGMVRAKEEFGTDFDRILREFDGRYFGFASKSFYAEFLAAREIAENPSAFYPEGLNVEPPIALDSVVLDAAISPVRLARSYGVPLGTLASLNPAWTRRAVRGSASLPSGSEVWLPEGTLDRIAPKKRQAPKTPEIQAGAGGSTSDAAIPDRTVHVVNRGESLFGIATVYGVNLTDLLGLNRLTLRSIIHPGQRLLIPAR